MGCLMMVALTLFFHTSLPPPKIAMVVHEVGVDDDVTEVCIRSHSRSEDGEEKISQGEQNVDIQGGEDEEGNLFLKMMKAYVPRET